MDRQRIGLKLALDALGHDLDLSDFDGRLLLQKTIYLAQAAGVDLGYTFGWYLRGPYSPSLTRDAFALRAELTQNGDELKDWKLDPAPQGHLAKLRLVIQAIPAEDRVRRLELLASVHFLLRTRQAQSTDIAGLRAVLLHSGKNYPESDIQDAMKDLGQHGFLPPGGPR
jgi:hypothetical protein